MAHVRLVLNGVSSTTRHHSTLRHHGKSRQSCANMAAEQILLPFIRTPSEAMRSPSPLAGSKRNSSGEVLEASNWKRHMVENFGCEIETGECHRPICVNPQHLLVNGDTHDDLHRHKSCLIASSHHDSPASSRHLPPLTTGVTDICKESNCHAAAPHSASDSRCEGMFWDSCSPTCSGDEACPMPDACADPNCDLQDVCWDNLCTQIDCTAQPCPDGLCLVDEVCYKEPCPRASSCEQTHHCAPQLGDHIDHDIYSQSFSPACNNLSNHQNLCQELENWIAANGVATSNADQPFQHCYNAHGQGNYHCNLPQYHSNGHCSHASPSCYQMNSTIGQPGSSSLDELSRLAQLNEHLLNCTFPHTTIPSQSTSTRTLGNSSIDHCSLSGSVVSSPDPHLPFRPHQQQNLSDFFQPSELSEMGFKSLDGYPEPPSKKVWEMTRSGNATSTLFESSDAFQDISASLGVAQSVENVEHVCLWKVNLKQEDGKPGLCNKKFNSAKDLAEHMKEEHTEGADGKYCCQWHGCTSSTDFKQSGKLARHFAIHSKCK